MLIDLPGVSCLQPLREGGPVPRRVPWLLTYEEVRDDGRVSISCDQVSHVSGVGQLPAKYILNDDHGLVRVEGGLGHVSLDVLDLNFLSHPSIL